MHDQVVAITGASRGIGAQTARVFAEAGAKVALLARDEAAISALAHEIGEAAIALPCDVANPTAVFDAVAAISARWGRLDVWIGNAGVITPIARIEDANPVDWASAININLTGIFNGMRAVIPLMK